MIDRKDVAAIIVTRGDVPLDTSYLIWPEVIVWDNSQEFDLGAYGRYQAIGSTSAPIIFFIDDDCTVTTEAQLGLLAAYEDGVFVSNMNPAHNGGLYPLLALPGWGSLTHRDLPMQAFTRWREAHPGDWLSDDFLRIGCDIVFPVLTESKMIDLGHDNLPHAHAEGRTWRRTDYPEKKAHYYREAAALR